MAGCIAHNCDEAATWMLGKSNTPEPEQIGFCDDHVIRLANRKVRLEQGHPPLPVEVLGDLMWHAARDW